MTTYYERYYSNLSIRQARLKYQEITNGSEEDFWQLLGTTEEKALFPAEKIYHLPRQSVPIMTMLLRGHPYLYPLLKARMIRKGL
jgi:hypothetical protein